MKRTISLILLLIVVFLGMELIITKLMKKHTVSYSIYNNDIKLSVKEEYLKNNGDNYNIEINDGNNTFIYVIKNNFNKQKKIISSINYYKDGDSVCIYPILKDNTGTYIECSSNGNLYSGFAYSNQSFIDSIKNDLNTKGYNTNVNNDLTIKNYGGLQLYINNLKDTDIITTWQYKGINIYTNEKQASAMPLRFDKYENKLGALVGKYYVIPGYTNSNVLEFSYVTVVDVTTSKESKIELDNVILSSDTYINGIVNGKLYYTDPSNLQQVEINPSKKKAKLIGNIEMGGKMYDGKWKDRNIYDFKSEIKFINTNGINMSYKIIKEGKDSYYLYDGNNIYQLVKGYLDKPILIYRIDNINNLNVIGNDICYVVDDTLYEFSLNNGNIPLLKGKDLIYNTNNRVNVYRSK